MIEFTTKKRRFILKFADNSFKLFEIKVCMDENSKNYLKQTHESVGEFYELKYLYKWFIKAHLADDNVKTLQKMSDVIEETGAKFDTLFERKERSK